MDNMYVAIQMSVLLFRQYMQNPNAIVMCIQGTLINSVRM